MYGGGGCIIFIAAQLRSMQLGVCGRTNLSRRGALALGSQEQVISKCLLLGTCAHACMGTIESVHVSRILIWLYLVCVCVCVHGAGFCLSTL